MGTQNGGPATLERFGFSAHVGFPVKINTIPGERCVRNGYVALTGGAINGAIVRIVDAVLTRLRSVDMVIQLR